MPRKNRCSGGKIFWLNITWHRKHLLKMFMVPPSWCWCVSIRESPGRKVAKEFLKSHLVIDFDLIFAVSNMSIHLVYGIGHAGWNWLSLVCCVQLSTVYESKRNIQVFKSQVSLKMVSTSNRKFRFKSGLVAGTYLRERMKRSRANIAQKVSTDASSESAYKCGPLMTKLCSCQLQPPSIT